MTRRRPRSMLAAALLLSAALTSEGQPAVDRMIDEYRRLKAANALDEKADAQFRASLDRVCHQLDCASSGLYWHTDLAKALAEAKRLNRPVLALRLLGKLDEEMSCANSRYFRTLIYSNRAVADFMRSNFVLYWSSERPAPLVTIDFGDGRVLRRTITGNSIHYLLDAQGRPLDALPGLYAPLPFLAELRGMSGLARGGWSPRMARVEPHAAMVRRWAGAAAALAVSKSVAEAPMFSTLSFGVHAQVSPNSTRPTIPPELAVLDASSLALMRAKRAHAPIEGAGSDADLQNIVTAIQQKLREDTWQNETVLRPQIRKRFAEGPVTLEQLNRFVYDVVFATPREDPWLGLLPDDVFTGISREGFAEK